MYTIIVYGEKLTGTVSQVLSMASSIPDDWL